MGKLRKAVTAFFGITRDNELIQMICHKATRVTAEPDCCLVLSKKEFP